ncbi:MAG: sensor domain-containing diguanylate cyclase [Deltaproteobacteria bacterium]|nr:sensor domain-containing diguanylate cyclase [Deltaproteobacteria bacterium]MBI3295953.1 sensor domain-containing diguanylate cyclase [Deltaproteobacteria bacterium]
MSEVIQQWIAKNQGILEILLDAYVIVDKGNKVVHFNTAFTDLCGESYRKVLKIGNFCDLFKTTSCPDNCPAKQVLTAGGPIRLDEVNAASKAYPELITIIGGIPITSDSGEVVGSLLTIRNVTAETQLQKKYSERKQESVTDGLTHLYNKKFTESSLRRAIKANSRDAKGVSVVMFDIDFFKKVNDTYGHQAGDYVLAVTAKILREAVRETDVVGRYGGEEFMIVLSASDPTGAKIFAERTRQKLQETRMEFEGKHIPVTASLGTASFTEKTPYAQFPNIEEIVNDLVKKADTALYHSKANGRNRVTQFEELGVAAGSIPQKKAA